MPAAGRSRLILLWSHSAARTERNGDPEDCSWSQPCSSGWIAADPRNAEVLFPYLNGQDLNSRPDASASRWVIDFNNRTEEEAATYPLPYHRILTTVKPERQKRKANGAYVMRKPMPEKWWQYGEKRPLLRQAISELAEVLVIAVVSKTVMPLRVPTGQVFSNKLDVFATDSYSDQAVLSSSLHQLWAITYGSTLESRVAYTPSYVLEPYPFPPHSNYLAAIGRLLDEDRRTIMQRRSIGLTDIYNLVNDSYPNDSPDGDVTHLRELHEELDLAVIKAYGWDDIKLNHGVYNYRQAKRWTVDNLARVEILNRLLSENLARSYSQ